MPSEQFRFLLESIASAAGILALVAIALELLRARRADARDFLFQTYEKMGVLSADVRYVQAMEFDNLDEMLLLLGDEKVDIIWNNVFSFWDLFTKSVRANAIDKHMAFEHFGAPFLRYYQKHSNALQDWYAISMDLNNWESFDWFFNEFMSKYPREIEAEKTRRAYSAKVKAKAS